MSRKALALALLATAVAALFIGVNQSSATVLCGIEMETCPKSLPLPAKTKITGSLVKETTAVITAGMATVSCEKSTLTGVTKEKEAEPLSGEITALEFSGCTLKTGEKEKASSCTSVKGVHLPYSASFAYSAEVAGHGSMTPKNSGKGAPAIEFVCEKTKCVYDAEPVFSIGGEPTWGSVTKASATLEKESELTCPLSPKATFSATYALTESEGGEFWVAKKVAPGTKLCKTVPPEVGGVLTCPEGEGFMGAIQASLLATTNAKFSAGAAGEVICNQVSLTGSFEEDGTFTAVNGGIQTFTYRSGGGNCTSTLAGNPGVAVTMIGTAYNRSRITYSEPEPPQAALGFRGTNGVVKLRLVIGATTCIYRRDALTGQLTNGGAVSFLEISANWFIEAGQPAGCPMTFRQVPLSNLLTIEQAGGAALFFAGE